MTTAETYLSVLRELDQFEAPVFDPLDFNYWWKKSTDQVYRDLRVQYETSQISIDDISYMIESGELVFNETLATNSKVADLPEEYLNMLNVKAEFIFKAVMDQYAIGNKILQVADKISQEALNLYEKNYYQRPKITESEIRVFYKVTGSKLKIHFDTDLYPNPNLYISKAYLEFFKKPVYGELNENGTTLTEDAFPEEVQNMIVNKCATLFLENSERQRFQSHEIVN